MDDARAAIRDKALALGLDAVGFAAAAQGDAAKERLLQFLAAGRHGDMGWMADTADRRGRPHDLWPAARSIVVVGLNYGPEEDPLATLDRRDSATISVYARNRDYHDVLKKKLRPLTRWICETWGVDAKLFVDTAPVMEKPLAQAAGLGWQGKHTNLVSQSFGSWLFLGAVFTTLDLAPDVPTPDACGSCRACLDACPTAAFPAPYQLDARRCISYLTIEHRGPIPRDLRPLLGNRIYGCDDCLAACPWNKFAQAAREADLVARPALSAPDLAMLAGLDDASFRRLFAGSPVKRIGRGRFLRNVILAIANSGNRALVGAVLARLDDAHPLVRGAAAWALSRLDPARFAVERSVRLAAEADGETRAEWEGTTA
ncbi:MAG: tRNA epoxyqueuosine(34) reductase QueG [Alphaproteobacteria bacterium]|nr:tRNA epoxyqueuosine(34) reductase QueG [Alphaproteobacteria bacterium]